MHNRKIKTWIEWGDIHFPCVIGLHYYHYVQLVSEHWTVSFNSRTGTDVPVFSCRNKFTILLIQLFFILPLLFILVLARLRPNSFVFFFWNWKYTRKNKAWNPAIVSNNTSLNNLLFFVDRGVSVSLCIYSPDVSEFVLVSIPYTVPDLQCRTEELWCLQNMETLHEG